MRFMREPKRQGKSAQYREQFDLVTARAVAKFNVLNEFCLPLVKVGGRFVAMKGMDPNEEIAEAAYSIETLARSYHKLHPLQLPDESERHIIVIDKEQNAERLSAEAGNTAETTTFVTVTKLNKANVSRGTISSFSFRRNLMVCGEFKVTKSSVMTKRFIEQP